MDRRQKSQAFATTCSRFAAPEVRDKGSEVGLTGWISRGAGSSTSSVLFPAPSCKLLLQHRWALILFNTSKKTQKVEAEILLQNYFNQERKEEKQSAWGRHPPVHVVLKQLPLAWCLAFCKLWELLHPQYSNKTTAILSEQVLWLTKITCLRSHLNSYHSLLKWEKSSLQEELCAPHLP